MKAHNGFGEPWEFFDPSLLSPLWFTGPVGKFLAPNFIHRQQAFKLSEKIFYYNFLYQFRQMPVVEQFWITFPFSIKMQFYTQVYQK